MATRLTHPVVLRRHPSLLRKEGSCGIFPFFPFLWSNKDTFLTNIVIVEMGGLGGVEN